ncbi:epoxyqueuosine reductase [Clostridium estertheticum]|uniref:Epoxyqueuosine reductase n=1 Tax=Clostridium estertheticum TaxID=238834 RepID=A0A5N7J3I9_9CLOT|nr:4Fe-4S double cluster binding domain-containing protein [Clostridium estertheticum]MPQ32645.1 epoxyqueuosine reductase [Clostridium estertheticum]MPQ63304.1 epoxyqueuosine reductase [Clostridium estertheticum]
MINSEELKEYLYDKGASLVGFANLKSIVDSEINHGISIAINIPVEVVKSICNGPNMDYFNQYHSLNNKLNEIANSGADYLQNKGYKAVAQTTDVVKEFSNYRTLLPHKTVATMSGLGWIGKNALLTTEEFGSSIRLTSIITNAKLDYGTPVRESKCGDCLKCKDACPGRAISGELWHVGIDRDEFINIINCRRKARQIANDKIAKEITLCGKCIQICPYTQRYIKKG